MRIFKTSPKGCEHVELPGLKSSAVPRVYPWPILSIVFSLTHEFLARVVLPMSITFLLLAIAGCAWRKPLDIPVCDIETDYLNCTGRDGKDVRVALPAAATEGFVCFAPWDFEKLMTACKRENVFKK